MTTRGSARAYLPGLDGLRALAVVGVMAYHFDLTLAPGGFLGVDIFFVLSGYLITSQLWVRSDDAGRLDLLDFYRRRIRRLVPAVVVLVLACALAVLALDRTQGRPFLGDALAALTYSSNWWYVLHERSYFEAAGRPPVLQHLWSLAVEEQFYLLWPLVLLLVARRVPRASRRRRLLRTVSVVGAVASLLLMAVGTAAAHAPQTADVSRWYFGSDAHAFGLLAGAALALHRAGAGFHRGVPLRRATLRETRAGWLALLVVLAFMARVDAWTPWLYRVGFAGLVLATTVLVAVAARPGPFARLLGSRPLVAVGRRSYGLYLWHWPVACFTRPTIDVPLDGWALLALRVAVTAGLTELCYRLVEVPVRRDGVRATLARVTSSTRAPAASRALATGAAATVVGLLVTALATAPPARIDPSLAGSFSTPAADATPSAAPSAPASTSPAPTSPTPSPTGDSDVAARALAVYGDSVALGAQPGLARHFRTVTNHAAVGVQASEVMDHLDADARAGRTTGQIVLVHLGDNGPIDADQLRRALRRVDGHRVLLVRPRVPRPWQSRNLAVVDEVAGQVPSVRVVDWYGRSAGRPEWFVADGVHLQTPGIRAYAKLVRDVAARP